MKLYMLRTVPLSINRSLFTVHSAMVYVIQVCRQLFEQDLVLLKSSPLSTVILYGCLQRVTIPEAVIIQFDLLKMSIVLLETCRGL